MSIKETTKPDSPTGGKLFQPLPVKRTFKEIADQIRNSIYSKTLKPGDKLPSERELAVQFNVGRISVREALRMLEQAGLILIKQGSGGGAYVKAADTVAASESVYDLVWRNDVQIEHLTEARLAVEKQILQSAFGKFTENDLEMLGKCVEELETGVKERMKGDFHRDATPTNFHLLIARATKNPVFEIILKVLINVTVRVFNIQAGSPDISHLKKHVLSHRDIYKAIKSGNLKSAIEKMEEHLLEVAHQYSPTVRKKNIKKPADI